MSYSIRNTSLKSKKNGRITYGSAGFASSHEDIVNFAHDYKYYVHNTRLLLISGSLKQAYDIWLDGNYNKFRNTYIKAGIAAAKVALVNLYPKTALDGAITMLKMLIEDEYRNEPAGFMCLYSHYRYEYNLGSGFFLNENKGGWPIGSGLKAYLGEKVTGCRFYV